MKQQPKAILKKSFRFLPALLFAAVIVFSGVTAWHYANHILDSDAASELVLGKLLSDQNRLISPDWLYSTEIRAFGTNLVYIPLFKIFSDWQTIRFASMLVFQALLAGSYYYLSRRMKLSLYAFFLSASILLLPVNVIYGRLTLFHSYYAPSAIYGFFIAGLYLSVLEHRGQKRLWQILRLSLMLLLSFVSCLNGFRQLPSTMMPLFITALVVALSERRYPPDTLAGGSKRLWNNVLLAGAVFAAGFAGLFVHSNVLPLYYHFRILDTYSLALPSAENFRNLLDGYLRLFGFQGERILFSLEGILALGGVFAAVVLLIVSLRDIVPGERPARLSGQLMGAFYPIAMLCMTAIFLLVSGNDNYTQYYLPAFIWVVPYLGLQIGLFPNSLRQITIKHAAVALACLCLLAGGVYNNLYYLNPDDKQVEYDIGIDVHTLDKLSGAIEFINENELEVGYADFWLASIITEATDGRVAMIPIDYDYEYHVLVYHDILYNLQTLEESFIEDKSVFALTTIAQSYYFGDTDLAQYGILAYEDEEYRIYIFDFPTDVWEMMDQWNSI